MSEKNFNTCVQFILNDEGGYAERSNEPGGGCNKGISLLLLAEVWLREAKGTPTLEDLKHLTDDEAKEIYRYYVFDRVGFEHYPTGLDYVMVNTATMQGPTGAIKLLQETLGIPITGKLDDLTKETINKTDTWKMVAGVLLLQCREKMHDSRVGFWIDKGEMKRGFGKGWSNRIIRVWNRAKDMMEKENGIGQNRSS